MTAFKAIRARTPEDLEANWDETPTNPCLPLVTEAYCGACDEPKDCRNVADTGETPIWCCLTCDPIDAAQITWELERERKWLEEEDNALILRDNAPTDPCIPVFKS